MTTTQKPVEFWERALKAQEKPYMDKPLPEAVREEIVAIAEGDYQLENILQVFARQVWEAAAQQERARHDWQPIETAPEHEQVLAWDDERGSNPAILIDGEWFITYDDATIHPTHWMRWPDQPVVASHPPPTPEDR